MWRMLAALALLVFSGSISMASPELTEAARKWVLDHEARIKPLEIEAGIAWWERSEEHTSELQSH